MSNTPHTLADEFPTQLDAIHQLKMNDPAFARLLKEYDEMNDLVHRAESRIDAVTEEAEIQLRKRRLGLKDAIANRLAGR